MFLVCGFFFRVYSYYVRLIYISMLSRQSSWACHFCAHCFCFDRSGLYCHCFSALRVLLLFFYFRSRARSLTLYSYCQFLFRFLVLLGAEYLKCVMLSCHIHLLSPTLIIYPSFVHSVNLFFFFLIFCLLWSPRSLLSSSVSITLVFFHYFVTILVCGVFADHHSFYA